MATAPVNPLNMNGVGGGSLSDLRAKFGGAAPDSLSEYYRGGGLVPNISENNGVPTSGAISLLDFDGACTEMIELVGRTISDGSVEGGGNAVAGISFQNNGRIQSITDHAFTYTNIDEWLVPVRASSGDEFDIRLYSVSGTTPTGPSAGSWQNINGEPEWYLLRGVQGSNSCDLIFQIRYAGGGLLLQSPIITLSVGVAP